MHHPQWTLGWETHRDISRDTKGPCGSGVFAVTLDKAVLPGQPLCPSNHCMPLAGTGVASSRAANWM